MPKKYVSVKIKNKLSQLAKGYTTLVAAAELGFNYLGIEIEDNYIPIIEERIEKSRLEKEMNPTLF